MGFAPHTNANVSYHINGEVETKLVKAYFNSGRLDQVEDHRVSNNKKEHLKDVLIIVLDKFKLIYSYLFIKILIIFFFPHY